MKILFSLAALLACLLSVAQRSAEPNIFIITTDGFRWQEVFSGADSSIINDPQFVKDTGLLKQLYWDDVLEVRRKKLMPFFWNVIARQGQLYGNRNLNNKVNVKNIYKISYPGYNELLTGKADVKPVPNLPVYNNNRNILEYFNSLPEYKNKVAAFTSWAVFPFILNAKRSRIMLNSGWECIKDSTSNNMELINAVQDNITEKNNTRYDALTFEMAKEFIQKNHPKVVFLSFGETDEFAHHKQYDQYLQQANKVDKMMEELWYYVQTDPYYKNNTSFIISTDHGRGNKTQTWFKHNFWTKGSGEIWLALLGNGIVPMGEARTPDQLYQRQVPATIASLAGQSYPFAPAATPITIPKLVPHISPVIASHRSASFSKTVK